jgi:hypothetical protein
MKISNSAFKSLVKRCIAEVIVESEPPHEQWEDTFGNRMDGGYISEAGEQKIDRISPGERNKIGKAFQQLGLDGNGRFEKIEAGLAAVTKVLGSLGF